MAEPKTKQNDSDVRAFLQSVENNQRREDALQLCGLMSEWLNLPPKMWGKSIVGYGTYTYTYASGRTGDWMLAGFSPRKQNLTIYIMAGFEEYAETTGFNPEPLLAKLGPYTTGKSCLYIKKLDDINLDVLRELTLKSVEAMKQMYPAK